jgi:cytochrome oxidase complex assembly protein 1
MSTQPNYIPQSTVPASGVMPNQRKSWLGRYWIWLLVVVLLCGALFVFGIFSLIIGAMRGSDVAKEAVARAQSNSLVAQRLGAPISEGWFVSGSINVSTGSGDADLTVPISGPKGKGTVYVKALKTAGRWDYSLMQAAIDGSGDRIDLLASAGAAEPPTNTPSPAPQAPADVTSQTAPSSESAATAIAAQPSDTAPATAPPQAKPGSVVASAQYSNDPNLRCDVLEVKRVSGSALLARWRIVNTGTKPISYDFGWDDIYYIDPAGSKRYTFLTLDGKRILDMWSGSLPPGEQRVMWAKYPAPPPTSKRISLNIPKFTPFEDVPVSE